MLYPQSKKPLTDAMFLHPASEYRGAPFWAWNCQLNKDELLWQIDQLKLMGFGGFHMHVRTGMDTPYLSDEYMAFIRACVEKARREGMKAYLYDEDRWPSGAAGGLVTKGPENRMRYLVISREPQKEGRLLAEYDITLHEDGTLRAYAPLQGAAQGFALYAYVQIMADHPWHNNQGYLNVLDPQSVQAFIRTTHDRYAQAVGADFGGVIPSIFTDEPHFHRKGNLTFATDEQPLILPWTDDLPDTFRAACGLDLVAGLPELIWELPQGQTSAVRYHYHDHVTERFAAAFSDQCGRWCADHGLMLTGHMDEEATLESQTRALGEAMRNYRCFQLPGIDLLCDRREFTTAKQAQSAARQYGRCGVMSELYGVTNWDFDFRSQKLQGDWQAALGVTLRVPHLSWVSMNGHAKRDYPGTFNYQAPWYKEYARLEEHYARINTAMTRGKPLCRVGVIHPIESYWLHWGSQEQTGEIRRQMEERFLNLTKWLLHGQIDFDFLCESLLPEQVGEISGGQFPVGCMRYDVVVLPGLETIRSTTLDMLERLMVKGGRVILLGETPCLVDAMPSTRGQSLLGRCEKHGFDQMEIMQALQDVREVEIRCQTGSMADGLVHQLRQEGDERWLFLCHGDQPANPDLPRRQELRIRLKGLWRLTEYNTLTGRIIPLAAVQRNGWTELLRPFYDHDSLLLRMTPGESDALPAGRTEQQRTLVQRFLEPVEVALSEPNCLLLDMPQYALDDEPWQPREEILRIMQALYDRLGWGVCNNRVAQPWAEQDLSTPHTLRLRYTFSSRTELKGCQLALENAQASSVTLNGMPAEATAGWYVDKCIGLCALPEIKAGENVLEIVVPFGRKTPVESCYLLGDFCVEVLGASCVLDQPCRRLPFGDITRLGLPFYGGNVSYRMQLHLDQGEYELDTTCYRGHLVRLKVDGRDVGVTALSPYRAGFAVEAGLHRLEVICYGCRINTFGQVHHANKQEFWWGPDSWRSAGAAWTYEYALWPQGVLKSPELFRVERKVP